MQQNYGNLPGHQINHRDGNLSVSPPLAPGKSVMILGTATDGPVMSPVPIRRIEQGTDIFGEIVNQYGNHNGSTLLKGLFETWAGGARNVHLMRISGKKASVALVSEKYEEVKTKKYDHTLGFKTGNSQKQVFLPLLPGDKILDAEVVADGQSIPKSGFDIDNESNSIIVHNDVADADADAMFYFSFERKEQVAMTSPEAMVAIDELHTKFRDANHRMDWVDGAVLQIFVNDQQQSVDSYTVDTDGDGQPTGIITFNEPRATNAIVTWKGTYVNTVVYSPNSLELVEGIPVGQYPTNPSESIVLSGLSQHFDLMATPDLSSFKLFANGYEVAQNGYYLDAEAKTLIVRDTAAPNHASLRVRYDSTTTEDVKGKILFEGLNAGEIYNDVQIKVDELPGGQSIKRITIIKPQSKKSNSYEPTMQFSSVDYPDFKALVNAINTHPFNNVVRASTPSPKLKTETLKTVNSIYLNGGDSEIDLSREEIYERLAGVRDNEGNIIEFGVYDLLEHYDVDMVLPQGVYADQDADDLGEQSFSRQLAQYCAVATMRNSETVGMIPTAPIENNTLPEIYKKATSLVQDSLIGKYQFFMRNVRGDVMYDDDNKPIDIGKFISVVTMTDCIVSHSLLGVYPSTACNFIAGMRAANRADMGVTNKALKGVSALRYNLSLDQLNRLTGARFVTVGKKHVKGEEVIYVVDGVTMAETGSDFARMTTMDITNFVTQTLRSISDPYIGNGYGDAEQASHTTELQEELDLLVELGIITDFNFQIHASLSDQILGNAIIELEIVPKFELRKIQTFVSLRPTI